MSVSSPYTSALHAAPSASALRLAAVWLLCVSLLPLWARSEAVAAGIEHIVVSELAAGGTSANDELIELYNPSAVALPLEGLELVYVSATGTTVSRRAAWDLGAAEMPPGSHLLVAHELGAFAPIADALYSSGMAATGGSVALRIQGAAAAIDALGWGTATSTWLEGTPAPPAPAGSSLERLPGGPAGSTEDTDDNAADFAVRATPDPQNSGSPPVPDPDAPSPTPSPPSPTPSTTPGPTPTGAPDPTPTSSAAIPIATARALPDGGVVVIEGTALTGSDFHDGGGYLADESGGIAVLVDGGSFARGDRLVVSGVLDDRFAQRTVRAVAADVDAIGSGQDPAALPRTTATVDESVEGRLVRVAGSLVGSPSPLSGAVAFDLDDGSGSVRLVVGDTTGIDTSGWTAGRGIEMVGVIGQRDSSGSGASGYRVQPRSGADVVRLVDPTPSPGPSGSPGQPSGSPSAAPSGVSTIAQARAAERNERLTVRGVVTLPPGVIDPSSAVIQDATGAILLRLGSDVGRLPRGQLVEVEGVRSTKSGMESLRVSRAARRLGKVAEPQPRALRTGDATEAHEARVVVVRGALVAAARRASSRAVSFEIDDGSGAIRVVLGAPLRADPGRLSKGTWVEVRGVLGQETSGSQPLRGYRIWPRTVGEVRVTAPASSATLEGGEAGGSDAASALSSLDGAGGADLRVGATLVASVWPELGIAGLLWDGHRLVAIAPSSSDALASAIGSRVPPISLELSGMREVGIVSGLGVATVALGTGASDSVTGTSPLHPPIGELPGRGEPAQWVSVVGRSPRTAGEVAYRVGNGSVTVEQACDAEVPALEGTVGITGIALDGGTRIVVPCGGIRAASLLARGAVRSTSDGANAGLAADREAATTDGREAPRRVLGAVLLAVAVAGIGGAAVVRHRLGTGPPAIALDPEVDADTMPEEPVTAGPAPERPRLTLVQVPRERSP